MKGSRKRKVPGQATRYISSFFKFIEGKDLSPSDAGASSTKKGREAPLYIPVPQPKRIRRKRRSFLEDVERYEVKSMAQNARLKQQ